MASNDAMDVICEAAAALAAGDRSRADSIGMQEILELAALGGARALGLGDEVGSLEPGKQADLAAFPLGAASERVRVSGGLPGERTPPASASLVVVAGRTLVRDGRLLVGDEGLHDRVTSAAARISAWRRETGAR
jgi:5-methylthioadenosine/S-adenosylhomocysteine deaminase